MVVSVVLNSTNPSSESDPNSSTLSTRLERSDDNEAGNNEVTQEQAVGKNLSTFGSRSMARDTSDCGRDTSSLEELRQAHNSILNVTEDSDDDEEDEEERVSDDSSVSSFLFDPEEFMVPDDEFLRVDERHGGVEGGNAKNHHSANDQNHPNDVGGNSDSVAATSNTTAFSNNNNFSTAITTTTTARTSSPPPSQAAASVSTAAVATQRDNDRKQSSPIPSDSGTSSSPAGTSETPTATPSGPVSANCCTTTTEHRPQNIIEWIDTSATKLTESFTESFCPGSTALAATVSDTTTTTTATTTTTTTKDPAQQQLQHQLELDILSFLGCYESPTDEELDAWVAPVAMCPLTDLPIVHQTLPMHFGPQKRNARSRAQRIHALQQQLNRAPITTAYNTNNNNNNNSSFLQASKSVDDSLMLRQQQQEEATSDAEISFQETVASLLLLTTEDDLGKVIGKGMEPIPSLEPTLDGYDSDPEDFMTCRDFDSEHSQQHFDTPADIFRSQTSGLNDSVLSQEAEDRMDDAMCSDEIHQAVQESLNYVWTLTWHAPDQDPTPVRFWVERGNILNYGRNVMEPKFMWRPAVSTVAAPFSLRMLSACRVLGPSSLDRSVYPLARSSRSLVMRTCDDEEFLFEAASESERDAILQQWKLLVARLASLAVLEDMEGIASEFFNPVHTNAMMVTYK